MYHQNIITTGKASALPKCIEPLLKSLQLRQGEMLAKTHVYLMTFTCP